MNQDWIDQFPDLNLLDAETRRIVSERSTIARLPADTVIFGPGKAAENWLLVLDGTVRVSQVSESGREIVLYRVTGGETCILTTHCLLAQEEYIADGVAETDVEAIVIAKASFDELISRSARFRRFVFAAYSNRINELLLVIQEVAFSRIDIRLAQVLVDLANSQGKLTATHQKLATELGTAREVVSRQLLEFQRRGWIATARGQVTIHDRSALQFLSREK